MVKLAKRCCVCRGCCELPLIVRERQKLWIRATYRPHYAYFDRVKCLRRIVGQWPTIVNGVRTITAELRTYYF